MVMRFIRLKKPSRKYRFRFVNSRYVINQDKFACSKQLVISW